MKLSRNLFPFVALVACSSSAEMTYSSADFVRVSCSSMDGGQTCFGYGEIYANGKSDACGRVPGGSEFAFQMTYEVRENTVCETVVKTSDATVMPVGEMVCAIYKERKPNAFVYRFADDPADKVRLSYDADRSDKWCQHLIDAL